MAHLDSKCSKCSDLSPHWALSPKDIWCGRSCRLAISIHSKIPPAGLSGLQRPESWKLHFPDSLTARVLDSIRFCVRCRRFGRQKWNGDHLLAASPGKQGCGEAAFFCNSESVSNHSLCGWGEACCKAKWLPNLGLQQQPGVLELHSFNDNSGFCAFPMREVAAYLVGQVCKVLKSFSYKSTWESLLPTLPIILQAPNFLCESTFYLK